MTSFEQRFLTSFLSKLKRCEELETEIQESIAPLLTEWVATVCSVAVPLNLWEGGGGRRGDSSPVSHQQQRTPLVFALDDAVSADLCVLRQAPASSGSPLHAEGGELRRLAGQRHSLFALLKHLVNGAGSRQRAGDPGTAASNSAEKVEKRGDSDEDFSTAILTLASASLTYLLCGAVLALYHLLHTPFTSFSQSAQDFHRPCVERLSREPYSASGVYAAVSDLFPSFPPGDSSGVLLSGLCSGLFTLCAAQSSKTEGEESGRKSSARKAVRCAAVMDFYMKKLLRVTQASSTPSCSPPSCTRSVGILCAVALEPLRPDAATANQHRHRKRAREDDEEDDDDEIVVARACAHRSVLAAGLLIVKKVLGEDEYSSTICSESKYRGGSIQFYTPMAVQSAG